MTRVEEQKQPPKSTPERLAVGTPGVPGLGEHAGLILTTVMELQHSVGRLQQAVETLTTHVDDQGKKLNSISHQIYAAWAVLVVIVALSGFLLDKFWNVIVKIVDKGLS